MNQAIIIATTPNRYFWLQECLSYLFDYSKYQIIILSDFTYFYGKMNYLIKHTDLDEFIMIPDTCMIKDTTLFEMCFKEHQGKNVSFSKDIPYDFWMSMGKFKTSTLRAMYIPDVVTKEDELTAEIVFAQQIQLAEKYIALFDDLSFDHLVDNPRTGKRCRTIEKHGRLNRIIENDYFIKYQRIG